MGLKADRPRYPNRKMKKLLGITKQHTGGTTDLFMDIGASKWKKPKPQLGKFGPASPVRKIDPSKL